MAAQKLTSEDEYDHPMTIFSVRKWVRFHKRGEEWQEYSELYRLGLLQYPPGPVLTTASSLYLCLSSPLLGAIFLPWRGLYHRVLKQLYNYQSVRV